MLSWSETCWLQFSLDPSYREKRKPNFLLICSSLQMFNLISALIRLRNCTCGSTICKMDQFVNQFRRSSVLVTCQHMTSTLRWNSFNQRRPIRSSHFSITFGRRGQAKVGGLQHAGPFLTCKCEPITTRRVSTISGTATADQANYHFIS